MAVGMALAVHAYRIPSGSMEPTLKVGQRVLVNRIGMRLSGPHVGEIVVLRPPKNVSDKVCGPTPHMVSPGGAACSSPVPEADTKVPFIKRIVAGPGDMLYIKEGHAYRNGKRENYL